MKHKRATRGAALVGLAVALGSGVVSRVALTGVFD
jgi:hypothetical protein